MIDALLHWHGALRNVIVLLCAVASIVWAIRNRK
jgi:hypothetical protein